jgi:glycosyltransferase involved in cell wall biosynthesis
MSEITIILPVYNASLYLRAAIESILNQTFKDFTLFIVNDASTDSSEEIVQSFSDNRIKYFRNEKNLGLICTLNNALSIVETPYVARMDADDIALPDRLKVQLATIKAYFDVAMVCSPVIGITPGGKIRDHWPTDILTNSWEKIRKTLPFENCISHPTILIKTEVAKKYRYSNNQKGSEDWDLWLRLARDNQKIIKTKKELLYYRIHAESVTQLENSIHSPQIKSIRVKLKFVLASILQTRINWFVFVTFLSILNDLQYHLRKSFFPTFLRGLKRFFTINPFKAYKQFVILQKSLSNSSSEYFLFFPYSHLGGAEKVHGEITRVLDHEQPFVFITGIHNGDYRAEFFDANARILHIAAALYHPFFRKKSNRSIFEKIFSCNNPIVFGANNQYFEELVPRLPPSVFCCDLTHDIHYNGNAFFTNKYLSYVTRLDKRIFISSAAINKTEQFYKKNFLDDQFFNRIELVYNFVNSPLERSKRNAQPIVVMYCGRDTAEKRVDRVLALAKLCDEKKLSVNFILIGDIKVPGHLKINNLHSLGMITDFEKLSTYYSKAHFVIITSDSEGFPLSLAEGMMHGCIPLSTNVGDIPNHIIHEKNGFLFDVNSNTILSDFLYVIENFHKFDQEKISSAAKLYADEVFNRESFYKFYKKLFRLPY